MAAPTRWFARGRLSRRHRLVGDIKRAKDVSDSANAWPFQRICVVLLDRGMIARGRTYVYDAALFASRRRAHPRLEGGSSRSAGSFLADLLGAIVCMLCRSPADDFPLLTNLKAPRRYNPTTLAEACTARYLCPRASSCADGAASVWCFGWGSFSAHRRIRCLVKAGDVRSTTSAFISDLARRLRPTASAPMIEVLFHDHGVSASHLF